MALLPLMIFFNSGADFLFSGLESRSNPASTGTVEKMVATGGMVAVDLDVARLSGPTAKQAPLTALRFDVESNSFFTVMAFNGELRGPLPSAMTLRPQYSAALPSKLGAAYSSLVFENTEPGTSNYEFVIRDAKSGMVFFNIEGHEYFFDAKQRTLDIQGGRVLISEEYAASLGRPGDAGVIVGQIGIRATLRTIEVSQVEDGEVVANTLPAMNMPGTTPGPDVVVGDVVGLAQFGSSAGTQVGLAVGTDSCNYGTVDLNWFALPNNDHPVIPQNLYRMSGGADNTERFEQIGQSSVKHAFTALTQNLCALGCNGVGGSRLGSGCSDPYSASLNSGPNLGSRAWINPFTGAYPRGDSATPPNNHTGHTHLGPSHRILTEINDLSTTLNPGATYYAEAQYVTPHEYAWCQSNPTQCNMYNNVSYRRYNVSGTGSPFSFSPAAATVRMTPAIAAWTGATLVELKPAPGVDGVGMIGYKVTNPSPGVWHYEYAIYNQNIDRGIGSFGVNIPTGVNVTNIGFKAPPQHPGWSADGTANSAGFSSTPWASNLANGVLTWNTETFAQNQNANAIRWGTMYNFRFDSNRPPTLANATVGFFKTGDPIVVQVQAPSTPVANASVGGRVSTSDGRAVYLAQVTLTDSNNNVRTTNTNPFGYYSFSNVPTGVTYTIAVRKKRLVFTPQNVPVNDNITNLNFVAAP